jgi:hypothetical protein
MTLKWTKMVISQTNTFTLKDFRERTGLSRSKAIEALQRMVMEQRLRVGQRKGTRNGKTASFNENVYAWNFNEFYNNPFNKGKK